MTMEKIGDIALLATVMMTIILIYITIQTNGSLIQKFPASVPRHYVEIWTVCWSDVSEDTICTESQATESTFLGASKKLLKVPSWTSSVMCTETPAQWTCNNIRIWYK